MHPQLSQRLLTIANFVSPKSFVIDIGTDHALLPIYLILTGKTSSAFAVDKNKKPLLQAEKNIAHFLVNQKCTIHHSDGFCNLDYVTPASICMAGMGGHTILTILQGKDTEQRHPVKELILQPNNNLSLVRQTLLDKNWKLINEEIIKENKRFFVTMKWVPPTSNKEHSPNHTPTEIALGPFLLREKSDIFVEWLIYEKHRLLSIQSHAKRHFLKQHQQYLYILEDVLSKIML